MKHINSMNDFTKRQLINACRTLTGKVGDEGRQTREDYVARLEDFTVKQIKNCLNIEETMPQTTPQTTIPTTPNSTSDAQQLADLISKMATPAVDAAQVRDIVAQQLKGIVQPTKTIVVHAANKIELDEHTHPAFDETLLYAGLRQSILLVGPAGTGKTFLAKQVATALALPFASISCTAGMSESALTGRLIPTGEGGKFEYQESDFIRIYEKGGVFLFDEMDASDANVLMIVNQALANGGFYVSHRSGNTFVKRHPDFVCIGAANTFGNGGNIVYAGRERLDSATLDRFEILPIDYDLDFEKTVSVPSVLSWAHHVRAKIGETKLRRVMSTRRIMAMSQQVTAGLSLDVIKSRYFASWSDDEQRKVS